MIKLITVLTAFLGRWKRTFAMVFAVLLLAVFAVYSPASAQASKLMNITQANTAESEKESKELTPDQQRKNAKLALTEAQRDRERMLGASRGISRQDAQERYRLLDGLVTAFNSHIYLIDEREELRRTRTAVEHKAKSWTGFPEPPPYSILRVDELMGSVQSARAKAQGLSANQELLAQQIAQYRETARQAQEMERQAADEYESARSSEERVIASWQKELMGFRARNADAVAVSIALRHEVLAERLGIARVELELLERQLAEARKRMVFRRADLNKALADLTSSRESLEQELADSLVRDARNRSELTRSRQELDSFALRHGKGKASSQIVARRDVLEARNRSALAWVESSRFEIEVVSSLVAMNKSSSSLWEKRYAAITGSDAEKQRAILGQFRKSREQLKPWLEYTNQQLVLYESADREQESRLDKNGEQGPARAAEQDLQAALRFQRQLAERLNAAVKQVDLERRSWVEDMESAQQSRSLTDSARDWFGTLSDILRRVWRFELFTIKDSMEVAGQKVVTSRGITVGKSVGALILFIVGYLIAAFLGRRVQRILVARFGVGMHQSNVIRRWLLALTIFILLIITLNLVRIPLTVFAFLGGALAIGVGFGTQTHIKNFISGILILLERNIKVGDTIDVDGVVGRIVTVDIRASTVLGFDGVETVIPNSTFLENKVTNWTHTNARLRRIVRVGVAYGSPATRVRDILAECGNDHGLILKNPPPEVFFEEFGDNSLIFALFYWIDYGPEVNPMHVASDLRFMIDKRFAEEQIVLAFPQRDIHLDSAQPLRIEVVSPPGNKSGPAV
ncbi:MAG: mechanosensitive ion channel [Deltaproteobacteria bacterium]|nr:mechanosensitive ion channel [Deltaproteobacteria bacterium]TLN01411.1 MAG: mechanosensitive ion channel [bacterium]